MNIRCSFCQTPYTLGRVEKLAALQHMYTENLNHYDSHCPRCRRANPVLRQKLEMTMPNWRDALKELEAEMTAHPQKEAPPLRGKPETAPVAETGSKPAQAPVKEKLEAMAKPAAQAPAKEKPEAKTKRASQKPAAQPKASAKRARTAKKTETKKGK